LAMRIFLNMRQYQLGAHSSTSPAAAACSQSLIRKLRELKSAYGHSSHGE
jgi:hypothetical protein